MAEKCSSLLRLVKERALTKREQDKKQESTVPYIAKDCISNILVRLPVESVQRLRSVCKSWNGIVNSPVFIDAHLQRSETVLIFLSHVTKDLSYHHLNPSTLQRLATAFSVEHKLCELQSVPVFQQPLLEPSLTLFIKFMEIKDGKSTIREYNATCLGKIRASCNGLILLDNKMKEGGLIAMNPVTRKLTALPLGTLSRPHNESYGLAFCYLTTKYKLVHLFRDDMQYVSCEILDLGARSWRVVDGPSFGLFGWFCYEPVFATGALHWLPQVDHNDYTISMAMGEEKFQMIQLPKEGGRHDKIVEIHGLLGFVTHHEETSQIDVWVLRSLGGEGWTKQHKVVVGGNSSLTPLYCSRINCEIIFKDDDDSLYAYDYSSHIMQKVDTIKSPMSYCCLPHVNSLVSWRIDEQSQLMDY